MSISSEAARLARLTAQVGQATLHHLYPDEFEYYAVALELLDKTGKQLAYLLFPVMPDSISINDPTLTTVKKTAGGLVSLHNPTYTPSECSISGSFGRRLRLLISGAQVDVGSAFVTGALATPGAGAGLNLKQLAQTAGQATKQIVQSFSYSAKTGYGATKVLEQIIKLAKSVDRDGDPYQLYFYNLAFNRQELIEPAGLTFTQTLEKNMIWSYSLAFRTMAPAAAVRGADATKAGVVQALAVDVAQKAIVTTGNILSDLGERAQNVALSATSRAGRQNLKRGFSLI